MAKSGSNPQFLNVEKKVQYNIRLPQRLIDKYIAYAELTGNTTTNIINSVLDDFIADKVVLNDYLDNIGGVTVKIPYAISQKNRFEDTEEELKQYNKNKYIRYYFSDTFEDEKYFAELFEVKKISNNLDIFSDDSYVANKSILKFNKNAGHSGIELFIYNITEIIFADKSILEKFDSFVDCLYCLYFEVAANESKTDVYLIDYLSAINLLSAAGNDDYKNLIIAAATELEDIDNVVNSYRDSCVDAENEIEETYVSDNEMTDAEYEAYEKNVKVLEIKKKNKCKAKCNELVNAIVNKYNSNNIIKFGSDIFSRLAIKEIEVAPDIDDVINEKVDAKFNEKIGELEKLTADNAKINNENKMIESELNKTK